MKTALFAEEVLHYTYDGDQAADRNRVRVVTSHAGFRATSTAMSTISAPTDTGSNGVDALRPAGGGAFPVMRYVDNNRCAGSGLRGQPHVRHGLSVPKPSRAMCSATG